MSRELIDLAVERLREDFPNKSRSWVRRALVRFMKGTVREFNENTWVVKGLTGLGDKYPTYVVRFKDGRYYCSCFESSWGLRRRSEICTHCRGYFVQKLQEARQRGLRLGNKH